MIHFWENIDSFFALLIGNVISLFTQKTCNLLIIKKLPNSQLSDNQ